jgi:hypothetical protein
VGIVREFLLVNDGNRRGLDAIAGGSGAHISPKAQQKLQDQPWLFLIPYGLDITHTGFAPRH